VKLKEDPNTPGMGFVIRDVAALAARSIWFVMGPLGLAAILVILVGIADGKKGWLTEHDVVYFVIVGLIIACRAIEQVSGVGVTAFGETSTWRDFWKYVLIVLPVVAGMWAVANLFANYVLG